MLALRDQTLLIQQLGAEGNRQNMGKSGKGSKRKNSKSKNEPDHSQSKKAPSLNSVELKRARSAMDARIARGNEDSGFPWRRARIEHHASALEREAARHRSEINPSARGGNIIMPPPWKLLKQGEEKEDGCLHVLRGSVLAVLLQNLNDEAALAQNIASCCSHRVGKGAHAHLPA
jgi:hypothetical protein